MSKARDELEEKTYSEVAYASLGADDELEEITDRILSQVDTYVKGIENRNAHAVENIHVIASASIWGEYIDPVSGKKLLNETAVRDIIGEDAEAIGGTPVSGAQARMNRHRAEQRQKAGLDE